MLFWQFLEYINIRDVRISVLKISGSVRSDFFRAFLSVGVFNWRNLVQTFSKIVCVEFNIKKRVLPVLIENILWFCIDFNLRLNLIYSTSGIIIHLLTLSCLKCASSTKTLKKIIYLIKICFYDWNIVFPFGKWKLAWMSVVRH